MCGCINSPRQTADDSHAGPRECIGKSFRLLTAVQRTPSRTDNRNRQFVLSFELTPAIQHARGIADLGQHGWIFGCLLQDQLDAEFTTTGQFPLSGVVAALIRNRRGQLCSDSRNLLPLLGTRREDTSRCAEPIYQQLLHPRTDPAHQIQPQNVE